MTTATNGQVKAAPTTAAEQVALAVKELDAADDSAFDWDRNYHVNRAQVRATLAVALADQRIADDEDRIAGCVPSGGSAFDVSVRGPQR